MCGNAIKSKNGVSFFADYFNVNLQIHDYARSKTNCNKSAILYPISNNIKKKSANMNLLLNTHTSQPKTRQTDK